MNGQLALHHLHRLQNPNPCLTLLVCVAVMGLLWLWSFWRFCRDPRVKSPARWQLARHFAFEEPGDGTWDLQDLNLRYSAETGRSRADVSGSYNGRRSRTSD